ncbi:MAG: hypothetical protein LBK95_00050 [Bifidobacteriaceae bacterium]|jgi:hypothetical protein|nr:hypothetical protein [Bifidobacteriaceae bacterium]
MFVMFESVGYPAAGPMIAQKTNNRLWSMEEMLWEVDRQGRTVDWHALM